MTHHAGFTGTLHDFLEWIDDQLCYGKVIIAETTHTDEFGQTLRRIETVTGGFSDDEALLERVQHSLFGAFYWASTYRGGLVTYEIPENYWAGDDVPRQWLDEEDDSILATIAHVDEVVVNKNYTDTQKAEQHRTIGENIEVVVRKDEGSRQNIVIVDYHIPHPEPSYETVVVL